MRTFFSMVYASMVVAACGAAPLPPHDAIAPAMAGEWTGTLQVIMTGANTTADSKITITLEAPMRAAISGLCPGSSEPLRIIGAGTRLSWNDVFSCPSSIVAGCEPATTVFTSATVSLYAGMSLNVDAVGTVSGCGSESTVHIIFDGAKQ